MTMPALHAENLVKRYGALVATDHVSLCVMPGEIHALILRKFPIVKTSGPHKGKPTKMSFKELQAITGELNRNGVKLPFRPRRKVKKEVQP